MTAIRDFAARYTSAGLSVLPIRADGSKAPALRSWQELQHRIGTEAELDSWFANGCGIGVIAGEVSGGLEILDFDAPGIFERFAAAVDAVAPGLLSRLPHIATPGSGHHLFLRCSAIEGNQKLAMSAANKVMIETRGQGGYVVAVGSPARCHTSGREYQHVGGPALEDVPTISPDERNILLRVARSFDERQQVETRTPQPPRPERVGLTPGDDFAARTSWGEILEPHGWTRITDDLWRRPGKTIGISVSTKATSKAGNALLRVFSSNAHPFEPDTSYGKFAAYVALNHDGDFATAAKTLSAMRYGEQTRQKTHHENEVDTEAEPITFSPISIGALVASNPTLRPPIIDGLLRRGETANVIAAPKVGKSWLAYDLALATATGGEWFGRYRCEQGRVLLIDNELHSETIAHRIPAVAHALSIPEVDYRKQIDVLALRGQLLDLHGIAKLLRSVAEGDYSMIILDAWYRAIPEGISENDNGAVAILYNAIDKMAAQIGCAWVNIHHASKGAQGDKTITDVGAGAGSQSRAADAHIVLRQHEEDGVIVLDAVVRSFKPVAPLALRWEWPCWHPDDYLDVSKLRGRLTRGEQRQSEKDQDGCAKIVAALAGGVTLTNRKLQGKTGISRERLNRLLCFLESEKQVVSTEVKVQGNATQEYSLAPPVRDVGD